MRTNSHEHCSARRQAEETLSEAATPLGEVLLTDRDLASATGIKRSTWQKWRVTGRGPLYLRIGSACRYRRSDVLRFLQESEQNSTSGYRGGPDTAGAA